MSDDDTEHSFDWNETVDATEIRVTVPADSDVTEAEVREAIEDLFSEDGADEGATESRDDEDVQTGARRKHGRDYCS